jgi:hypothetical protein
MRQRLGHRISRAAIPLAAAFTLSGCGAQAEPPNWFTSLSPASRFEVMGGALLAYFGLPLIFQLFYLAFQRARGRRDVSLERKQYWTGLQALTAVVVTGMIIAIILRLSGEVVSATVRWVARDFLIIAIVVMSLFLLIILLLRTTFDHRGRWVITCVLTGAVTAALILIKVGGLSGLTAGAAALACAEALTVIMLVIAVVEALSGSRGALSRDRGPGPAGRKWWFAGALAAAAAGGALMPVTLGEVFPGGQSRIAEISVAALRCLFYASILGVAFLPAQAGRAFYKISRDDDVTITRARKPKVQHQYQVAGYRCGQCGQSLPERSTTCPHCGARFNASREEYLPGTPRPKRTETTSHGTAAWAGFCLLLLLLADMAYGAALYEARHRLFQPGGAALLTVLGVPVANLVIIGLAAWFARRYAKVRGHIERTTYY